MDPRCCRTTRRLHSTTDGPGSGAESQRACKTSSPSARKPSRKAAQCHRHCTTTFRKQLYSPASFCRPGAAAASPARAPRRRAGRPPACAGCVRVRVRIFSVPKPRPRRASPCLPGSRLRRPRQSRFQGFQSISARTMINSRVGCYRPRDRGAWPCCWSLLRIP